MANPTGYLITSYGDMITCEPRMSAYAKALRAAVTPGCTVIDIGAGSGIFSLLACQYGAGRVIAIEPHDAVELLLATANANGFADRITVYKGISTDYVGPKADVIVSDLRSCLPLFEQHIPSIVDARERLLARGGRLIPARDRLFAALAYVPDLYRPYAEPWLRNAYDLDLSDGHRFVVNQWLKANLSPLDLMSTPQELLLLDYATITDPNISVDFVLVPEAPGETHGFLVWFDAELAPCIGFSNAPGEPEQVYGQTFFPFERPIELGTEDLIEIKLRANLIDGAYVWSWNTTLTRGQSSVPELSYRQSTFRSRILAPAKLAKRSSAYVPEASATHAINRHALALFDGRNSLGEIAKSLEADFPEHFARGDALIYVTDLADFYHQSERANDKPEPAKEKSS